MVAIELPLAPASIPIVLSLPGALHDEMNHTWRQTQEVQEVPTPDKLCLFNAFVS